MPHIIRFILPLLMLTFLSCTRNEFNVEFSLPADVNSNYRFVYHASSKHQSFIIESVAAVNKGKAELNCATRNPAVVYLFSPSSPRPRLIFWAERGDNIVISGQGSDPLKWEVKGNSISEQWTAWRLENSEAIASDKPEEVNKAVATYVKANPDSRLSALLMLTYYDRRADEKGFSTLWKSLGKDAHADEMAECVGRSDMLVPETAFANLRLLTLRSLPDRNDTIPYVTDTLSPIKAKGSIVYFWTSESDGRKTAVDTLRSLLKAYGKDERVVLAEVSLETDSLVWTSQARRDTLAGLKRLWLPGGVNNPEMIRIGVSRPDFFIVANPKGQQIYRGQSASKASETLRKLIRQ